MKETKNGATQARLRNQIKCLEKERDELKTSVENLQKENSKLNASRRIQRPSEVKMLHEINKNLTKLTEETFKKQLSKSGHVSPVSSRGSIKRGYKNEEENDENENKSTSTVRKLNILPILNSRGKIFESKYIRKKNILIWQMTIMYKNFSGFRE